MNIITQLVILTLSLLLVNADDNQQLLNHYTTNPSAVLINTCCDLRKYPALSGVYKISMGTFDTTKVYCDMTTDDDGGWIVIQRNRKNSQLSFNKNWREYGDGFGDLNNDFWAGLKLMNALTQTGQWEMRVDYQKNDKTWSYLHYNEFSVGSASEEYHLAVGGFTGEGTDQFVYHNGYNFSTLDNDNKNCATYWKGGWWYNNCYTININIQPPYYHYPNAALFTEMKIRPQDCITHY